MQCSICLGIPDQPKAMNCCKNIFCKRCIDQWVQIRSICPLCCAVTGQQKINNLKKKISNETFDDGSLIIETEMKLIRQRTNFIEQRVSNRRQQFKNFKSSMSASVMQYLQQEIQKIREMELQLQEQILTNNRGALFQCMQVIVEQILTLQRALQNNSIEADNHENQYQQNEEEEEDQQQSDYDQYDEYEINMEKKGKWKGNKKQKLSSNQNQNYSQKQKLKVAKQI